MKPFAKLRGAMVEKDVDNNALANYLNRSAAYISRRMNNLMGWEIEEAYKIMSFLELPAEDIFTYFPPNGGLPVKGRKSKIQFVGRRSGKEVNVKYGGA